MLGTNDLKSWFALTAWDIAFGAASLVNVINNPSKPLYGGAPKLFNKPYKTLAVHF
jgi:hypothetical protein